MLSSLVQEQIKTPSPIRQIMKMASREHIINIGLNPDDVISFGGGWVNHFSPKEFQEKYIEICKSKKEFHKSGGYSPTLGLDECRRMVVEFEKKIFEMKNLSVNNIIIGQSSTQITHDVLITLAEPNDNILLLDPTYANYKGQIAYTLPNSKIKYLKVLNSNTWEYLEDINEKIEEFKEIYSKYKPKITILPSPDNPTSQILPQEFVKSILEIAKKSYVAIDFAYKVLYFKEFPSYFSFSPNDYPNLISLHSNSKWCRGLGRRLGWLEANEEVIEGMERTQQCTILCPDTLHQMTMISYLKENLENGNLKNYLENARKDYENASKITISAIDKYLGFKRLVPQGGLYTVMKVNRDGDKFVKDILKNTGVLFIPGSGFGESLKNAVRISFGPLVNCTEKIKDGIERVGKYLNK